MKRIVFLALVLFLTVSSYAQVGVFGGLTRSKADFGELESQTQNSFHVGLAYKIPLALGFAIQPNLAYSIKGASLSNDGIKAMDFKMGYLEAAAQFQWGVDLMLFRPYIMAEPFFGYALNNKAEIATKSFNGSWDSLNRMEYGLGLGGGIEFLSRFQLSCKYYWNFGQVYKGNGNWADAIAEIKSAISEKKSFNGLALSLAFFF